MSSDPKLSKSKHDAQVSKLVIGAIKSLKKMRGSSSEAILRYIRSETSSNIDATDVERCLKIAHAEKIVTSRINKLSGIKFYKISQAPVATKKLQMETEDKKNDKSKKKLRKGKLKVKKDVNCSQKSEEAV